MRRVGNRRSGLELGISLDPGPRTLDLMTRSLSPFWTLFIRTGLNLFNYLDRSVVPAVLTDIKTHFALSDGQVGRINTIFMLGYFVTSPIFGYLGDRASRKWLIATGIFIWSVGTVLTGLASA